MVISGCVSPTFHRDFDFFSEVINNIMVPFLDMTLLSIEGVRICPPPSCIHLDREQSQ